MCGIVGIVGNITHAEEKAFKLMLQLDVVRGKDSTGMIAVYPDGSYNSHKEAWLPQDFLAHRQVTSMFARKLTALIGHNRAATVGGVSKVTAHPFDFDNIIGVHNGTTSKHLFDQGNTFDVDSEALYHNMEKNGVQDTWGKVDKAASLAWYDKELKTVNLLRNDERTLYRASSKDGKTIFFASEPWMITVACGKSGIQIDKPVINDINKHHAITLKGELDMMEVTPRPKATYENAYGWYGSQGNSAWSSRTTYPQGGIVKSSSLVRPNSSIHFTVKRLEDKGPEDSHHYVLEFEGLGQKVLGKCFSSKTSQADIRILERAMEGNFILEGDVSTTTTMNGVKSFTINPNTILEVYEDEPVGKF